MGLHCPFGYVGYVSQMGQTIIDMLERFCNHCHTDNDYENGCKGCPIGNYIFEARLYILTSMEEDKHFAEYASDEWQERRKANKMPEETQEQRDMWRKMSRLHKKESIALRGLKRELKNIIPHPFFYAQWRGDSKRHPDPLAKFREYLKDYHFHSERMFDDWRIAGEMDKVVRVRLKEELAPILTKTKKQRTEDYRKR